MIELTASKAILLLAENGDDATAENSTAADTVNKKLAT
jgi:hypothetical protein